MFLLDFDFKDGTSYGYVIVKAASLSSAIRIPQKNYTFGEYK